MNRKSLIRGNNLLVNLNHTVKEVLKRHHNDILGIYITEVPENEKDIIQCAKMFGTMYKNVVCELICVSVNSEYTKTMLSIQHLADSDLSELVPVQDDILVFSGGDCIVEVLTDNIHYICQLEHDELTLLRQKLKI
jgi:hypothetical protein